MTGRLSPLPESCQTIRQGADSVWNGTGSCCSLLVYMCFQNRPDHSFPVAGPDMFHFPVWRDKYVMRKPLYAIISLQSATVVAQFVPLDAFHSFYLKALLPYLLGVGADADHSQTAGIRPGYFLQFGNGSPTRAARLAPEVQQDVLTFEFSQMMLVSVGVV